MTLPSPNALDILSGELAAEHPAASLKIDRPLREDGVWQLDVDLDHHRIAVEWSPAHPRHFAITRVTDDSLFQMGGDAVCVTMKAARAQIRGLLAEKLS